MSDNGPAIYGPFASGGGGSASGPAPTTTVFDADGTYTDPGAEYTRFRIRLWGAGGDGGTADSGTPGVQIGSGGGGGGYAEAWFNREDHPLPWGVTVAVSAPDTSFVQDDAAAVLLAAESGTDGTATAVLSNQIVVGGVGGVGALGVEALWQGQQGGYGRNQNGSFEAGSGGDSPMGGAGAVGLNTATLPGTSFAGQAGAFPGGGGSGAFRISGSATVVGGAGARGLVIVEAY